MNYIYASLFLLSIFNLESATARSTSNANAITQQQKTKTIKGLVVDDLGDPLPGATVQIKGSTTGVITDMEGRFSDLKVAENDEIIVSFLGLETKTIPVRGKTEFTVPLLAAVSELDEVTVVAFGKQKKASVLSSITSVKPGELKVPSSNLTTALAGRIAGVIAYQRSGEPGRDNAEFFVRGVTTFGYKKRPVGIT